MSNHSEENYLDQLLNSLGNSNTKDQSKTPEESLTPQEAFERDIFGEPDSDTTLAAKDEEAFLREFEEELLKDDIPNFMDNFDRDVSAMADGQRDEALDASLDEILANMPNQPEPVVDENAEFEGELPEMPVLNDPVKPESLEKLDKAMGTFDGERTDEKKTHEETEQATAAPETAEQEMPPADDGMMDLSGMSDSDLLDMLSGDAELSDLGEMLLSQEEGKPIEEGDSIGDFAQEQMREQEKAVQPESDDGEKKKKKKKPSFLKKLAKLFFGEDDTEDTVIVSNNNGTDVSELSAENQQILKELEAAGGAGGISGGKKDKKGTKQKEKKEKKKKEPKPKKEKKEKPPKPKKEKKPKEKDNTPPLPRGPVIAIVIMVASLFGLVMVGTTFLGYQSKINAAQEAYNKGSYVEAFENLQGLKVKAKDEEMYNRLATLAAVSKKYQSYLIFDNYGTEDMAFDSLVCAYGRYDLNKKYAKEYDCEKELEQLGGKIIKTLLADYDMTGEEALELYRMKDRDDYTIELHKKLKELGLE